MTPYYQGKPSRSEELKAGEVTTTYIPAGSIPLAKIEEEEDDDPE